MLIFSLSIAAALLPALPNAQSSSTSTSVVPTGTAIAGDYSGTYRPQIHFSPPEGFMNDPNGMHRSADGTWHLYYQCE